MIVLLVVIGVAAIAILGRKYANTALPTVLALALCCCMSLGIYFYASVFSRASELIFAAVGGILLSAGVYALTNAICLRHTVIKDSTARTWGARKPLVEFVESDGQECEEKTGNDSEKVELPKLWEEETQGSESERRAFNEALDEALFADTEAAMEAKEAMEAVKPDTEENVEPEPMPGEAEAENETCEQADAMMLFVPAELDGISEDTKIKQELFNVEEEESDIPPLALEEITESEKVLEDAESEQELFTSEEESDIPPLTLKEIPEDCTLAEEHDFLPPLEDETDEPGEEETETQTEEAVELAEVIEDASEPEADAVKPAGAIAETDEKTAEEEAGMVEFDAGGIIRFFREEHEAAESKTAVGVEQAKEEVIELKPAELFEFVEKEDEAVEPEMVEFAETPAETYAKDISKDSEPYEEAFEAIELGMSESDVYAEEKEPEADKPVIEPELAFEPVPAPDDIKHRKDEAMAEVKALVAKRQYSDALTSLFALLNSGFALSEDEKHQLLIIMKLLKEKGI